MKKRKHRLVVEMTTSKPLTEIDAVRGLRILLDERTNLDQAPIWLTGNVYCDKLVPKQFSRVVRALSA